VETVLTPAQVASLLQIHVKTVYRLADEGVIPGTKIGRSWRFNKDSILEMLTTKPKEHARKKKPEEVFAQVRAAGEKEK